MVCESISMPFLLETTQLKLSQSRFDSTFLTANENSLKLHRFSSYFFPITLFGPVQSLTSPCPPSTWPLASWRIFFPFQAPNANCAKVLHIKRPLPSFLFITEFCFRSPFRIGDLQLHRYESYGKVCTLPTSITQQAE